MLNYKNILDISLPLNNQTVIYPGTTALEIVTGESETTKSVLSKLTLSSHTGTHIDAPKHAFIDREGIDSIPLSRFIGPSRIIDCSHSKGSISLNDVKNTHPEAGERLLFKTSNSQRGFDTFYTDFVYLSADAATYLAEKNVGLVGIDSWSIKQKGSKDNTPHTALLKKGIPILEGINLRDALASKYFLIVLPLRFTGIDASPARAILLS